MMIPDKREERHWPHYSLIHLALRYRFAMNGFRDIVKKGMNGDEDALKSLNLSDVEPLPFDESIHIDAPKLVADFRMLTVIREAATLMHQEGLAETARFGMQALHFLKGYLSFKGLEYKISKTDITREMISELENLRQFMGGCGEESSSFCSRTLQLFSGLSLSAGCRRNSPAEKEVIPGLIFAGDHTLTHPRCRL